MSRRGLPRERPSLRDSLPGEHSGSLVITVLWDFLTVQWNGINEPSLQTVKHHSVATVTRVQSSEVSVRQLKVQIGSFPGEANLQGLKMD